MRLAGFAIAGVLMVTAAGSADAVPADSSLLHARQPPGLTQAQLGNGIRRNCPYYGLFPNSGRYPPDKLVPHSRAIPAALCDTMSRMAAQIVQAGA
jgi:hypothetical protein